jgi:2-iminobutanoate/2-iminopropanoate deaminase
MLDIVRPKKIAPPFSRYAHGVLAASGCRWLHVSGQVGVMPDGTMAVGAEAQLVQSFANLLAVLEAAGMDRGHLVKLTVMLTARDQVPLYRQVRDRVLDGAEVASTLVIVAGLASTDFLVELEAVAAAPAG